MPGYLKALPEKKSQSPNAGRGQASELSGPRQLRD